MNRTFLKYLFVFVAYSFVGWGYEFIVGLIIDKDFTLSHGLLIGPFAPEYGLCACLFYLIFEFKRLDIKWKVIICTAIVTLIQMLRGMIRYFFEGKSMWQGYNFFINIYGHVHIVLAIGFFLFAIVFFIVTHLYVRRLLNKYAGHRSFALIVGIMLGLLIGNILQTFVFYDFK